MKRRDFIKSTCSVACACVGISALSLLQSCEDNKAYEQNVDDNNNGDNDVQFFIDISQSPYQELESIGINTRDEDFQTKYEEICHLLKVIPQLFYLCGAKHQIYNSWYLML